MSVHVFQFNHFPGSFQLGRKDRLWRNLSRLLAQFGRKEFGFFPQTFVLPADLANLKSAWEDGNTKKKWIVKPVSTPPSSVPPSRQCHNSSSNPKLWAKFDWAVSVHLMTVIYFASAAVAVASSHMTASLSASWSRFSPRLNFVFT